MIKIASWSLQVAVYDRLAAALSMAVYEGQVPQDDNGEPIDPPFVVIGESTGDAGFSAKREPGTIESLKIDCWTPSAGGYRDCKQTMDAISQALTGEELILEGFKVSGVQLEAYDTLTEEDGVRHGVLRFRFWIHQR